jgi:hypothetical protein
MMFNHEQNVCHEQNVFQEDRHLNLVDQHLQKLIDHEQNLLKEL